MKYEEFRNHLKTLGLTNKRFGELIGVEGKIINKYITQGIPKMSALLVVFMVKCREFGLELSDIEKLATDTYEKWLKNRTEN